MSLRGQLQERFRAAIRSAAAEGGIDLDEAEVPAMVALVREAADEKFGDYSATMAMPLAKRAKKPPREVAAAIIRRLDVSDLCDAVGEPVGPGFINLRISDDVLARKVALAAAGGRIGVEPVAAASG